MKTNALLLIGAFILMLSFGSASQTSQPANTGVTTSSELQPLVNLWVSEYAKTNPEVNLTVSVAGPVSELKTGQLYFFASGEKVNSEAYWKMTIGRDAIIPVINPNNPYAAEILHTGLTQDVIKSILTSQEELSWGSILNNDCPEKLHLLVPISGPVQQKLAVYVGTKEMQTVVTPVESVISAVQSDINALGFCRVDDILSGNSGEWDAGITLLPVDKNSNGRIDAFENIFASPADFLRGIWAGKYPMALCSEIYAVSAEKPADVTRMDFLSWISNDGQQYLNQFGFVNLASAEQSSNLALITGDELSDIQMAEPVRSGLWMLWAVLGIVAVLIAIPLARLLKSRSNVEKQEVELASSFNEGSLAAPQGLYYDKSHTWAFMEKDGKVKVGIDDFLLHVTGNLTRIRLREPGDMVRKGETVISIIRDGKQLNLKSPVSGTIREINTALINNPAIINNSPYEEGWAYRIEPRNWERETGFMLLGVNYREWLKAEFDRLRDFFTASMRTNTNVYAHVILQDGGEIVDKVLADMDPEVWEDFQSRFIDPAI